MHTFAHFLSPSGPILGLDFDSRKVKWPKGLSIDVHCITGFLLEDRGREHDRSSVGVALESTSMASSHAAMQQGWLFRVSNKGRLNSIARRSLALESGNPTRQPIDMVLQVTVPAFWSHE